MSRAISLYLPHFASDLVRRIRKSSQRVRRPDRRCAPSASCISQDETPILLQVAHAGRQLVAACCAGSIAAGVRPGMTMAHALAVLPEAGDGITSVIVETYEPQRTLRALQAMGRWAIRFSPLVAVDPPDGLLIDIAGCAHLFGDEAGLVDRVAGDVAALGFAARVAAAPTLACAWALARFGEADRVAIDAGGEHDALDPLPVAALGVAGDVVEALAEVGIDRIGHLTVLERDAVAARFGAGLLKRLDQALGRAPEVIDAVHDVGPPMVECVFAGPVKQLEAIQLAVRKLLDELVAALLKRECGVRKLEIQVDRADASPLRETLAFSHPSRDVKHLRSLMAPRVESMNLGFGVERMSLIATRTGRLPHEQIERWGSAVIDDRDRERALGELLDTLVSRLGHERVLLAEPADSHLPERSVRFKKERHEGTEARRHEVADSDPVGDRPALLFSRPEPITVIALTPEGPPVWFRWRTIEQRIIASAGPERIAEEWWRKTNHKAPKQRTDKRPKKTRGDVYARAYAGFMMRRDPEPCELESAQTQTTTSSFHHALAPPLAVRDYFKVQDEQGRWLWIFRVLETGSWFVHGLWA